MFKFAALLLIAGLASAAPAPQETDALRGEITFANQFLRVHFRLDNLTISVDDLAGAQTWGSDLWENSAGRVHLRCKHGGTATVNLSAAAAKR